MTSISHRASARTCIVLLVCSLILMPGLFSKRSPLTLTGSIASADASTPRSYSEFIEGAYFGALGRYPTCFEERAEYDALYNAAAVGSLRQEAERFVSTLFETQSSFDDAGGTYCQSPEYETLNPAACDPFINARSDQFITDLYEGFLLREPEPDGFNGWMQIIPSAGRKGVLNGFRFSVEFGVLVDALYPGVPPSCPPDSGEGGPCERGSQFYARLCP